MYSDEKEEQKPDYEPPSSNAHADDLDDVTAGAGTVADRWHLLCSSGEHPLWSACTSGDRPTSYCAIGTGGPKECGSGPRF